MKDYRERQLRDLLDAWHHDARLSVQQMKSLVDWEATPDGDARRLEAALNAQAEYQLSVH